jgi:hypothetical protein
MAQEGYDAVHALAWGLERDEGRGGARLTDQLEHLKDTTFSGFPIDLGPDDHVFPPRDQLGLFALAGPNEQVDPWQIPGSRPWRALMRTFTTDGERTNLLDRDRPVFFPGWTIYQRAPAYWQSIYGIVTRPRDRLH